MIKKIKYCLIVISLLTFSCLNTWAINNNILKIGDENAKVTVKVFSSLTFSFVCRIFLQILRLMVL